MNVTGRVWKYGDSIDTDLIFPAKYCYTVSDAGEMGEHALEGLDPDFSDGVRPGDVIVAGRNFGCGSSREQAVLALVAKGVGAVIARSFGRIFYRNCINNALPAITCPDAVDALETGDEVEIDLAKGQMRSDKGSFSFAPLPEAVRGIFDAGGLIPYTRHRLGLEE